MRETLPKTFPKERSSRGPAGGIASVKLELLHPLLVVLDDRLIFLEEDPLIDDENVDVGAHAAAVSVFGIAHDGLASHVERRVDDHGTSRLLEELVDEVVVARIRLAMDRLDARRVVDVGRRGNRRA